MAGTHKYGIDLEEELKTPPDIGGTTPAAGSFITGIFSGIVSLANNIWLRAKNFADDGYVNLFKVNVDDEIDVGATINLGTIEATEDSGAITLFDMPVSDTPAADTQESAVLKIDGDDVLTFGAFADSAGGVGGHFVQNHGTHFDKKTDGGAADYNPSALTSDYIITVDTTAAARAVTISTEDRDTGSATNVREFKIFDIAGNAGTNNITVSLETAGNINGAATFVMAVNYDAITLVVDGTNGYVI